MTSFSTNTGDEIEKFSPPKNPIYRVEYVESVLKRICESDEKKDHNICHLCELTLGARQYSVVGELLPLNNEYKKMMSKFDEYKKKNSEVKGDWLDELQYSNFDKRDLEDYTREISYEGKIHWKLFKHLQEYFESDEQEFEAEEAEFKKVDNKGYCINHYLVTKFERIA